MATDSDRRGPFLPSREEVRRQGALLRAWADHPRVAMAVRAALAAAIAWWLARLLPDPAAEYPFYAPLGAVVATTFTLAGSVRESLQAVAAIAIGGAIAHAADFVGSEDNPVTVAVVVAVGVLLAGWRRLGAMASWTTTGALFTLVIGGGETFYIGVFAGLVLLGGAVGIAINAVFPPLPLAPAVQAVQHVRSSLANQVHDLAEALAQNEPLDDEEWRRRQHNLEPQRSRMRAALDTASEARQGNIRARRHREALDELVRHGRGLDRVALLVQDLVDLLSMHERPDYEMVALGPDLRPAAADMVGGLERVVRGDGTDTAPEAVKEARDALARFVEHLDASRIERVGGGTMAATALAVSIARALTELEAIPPPQDVTRARRPRDGHDDRPAR
ncbi:hypothetical protein [Georgenia alba]|uniref:FUSC family protein n=1 Tax=Georgenia alba TaxID=2233858 RepID=A0ABW2Q7R5_9MICO